MEIIKDFTEEEFTKEIEIFTNLISDSNTNLYIPSYFQENFDIYKEDFDDLMLLLNSKEKSKTYYLKKIDFVEKDETEHLFLNEYTLKNKLNEIFHEYENYSIMENTTSFENFNGIVKQYSKVYNKVNAYPFNRCFLLKNKITNEILDLNIIIDNCNSKNVSLTIYHELCHSLQSFFDLDLEIDFFDILYKKRQLAKVFSTEELNSKVYIDFNIKYNKLFFLYKFQTESQAELFSNMIILLKVIQTKDLAYFTKVKDYLLFQSSKSDFIDGYFDFPSLHNICIFMEQNPEKYIKDFIKENNKIDFEKLYFFTKEQILERKQVYEKFLLQNENLDLDIYFKCLNSTFDEKRIFEPQYRLYSLIDHEKYFANLYNMHNEKKYEKILKNNFFSLVWNLSSRIEKNELKIDFLEEKLMLCQKKFSEHNYERIKGCFETISDKYKDFTIDLLPK